MYAFLHKARWPFGLHKKSTAAIFLPEYSGNLQTADYVLEIGI
jgi:hypothetical protein